MINSATSDDCVSFPALRSPDTGNWLFEWGPAKLAALSAGYALIIGVPLMVTPEQGIASTLSTRGAVLLALVGASYWTAATALVVRIVRRFPLEGGRFAAATGVHLWGVVSTTLLYAFLTAAVIVALQGEPAASQIEFALGHAMNTSLTLYLAIVVVATVVHAADRRRRAELRMVEAERLATSARLGTLQAQLQPHFLFNALNTVAMAVRRFSRDEALQVILDLSGLLRAALTQPASDLIALSDELTIVEHYLRIEQARYGDRMHVAIEMSPAAQNAGVPAMILQPLVENAVRHGFAGKSGVCTIAVRAVVEDATLLVTVEDDGSGFPAHWREGIGIGNVRSRLDVHFGADAALELQALSSAGTAVTLRMPYRQVTKQ